MEELLQLRDHIEHQRYAEALSLLDDFDDMSKKAILDTIQTFLERLLMHMIQNDIEQRMTNSWAASIRDSLMQIRKRNLKGNQVSWYIEQHQWDERLEEAYEVAIANASVEVLDGLYTPFELYEQAHRVEVLQRTKHLIALLYTHPPKLLPPVINEALSTLPGGDIWRYRK
jgi:hypothetical protein